MVLVFLLVVVVLGSSYSLLSCVLLFSSLHSSSTLLEVFLLYLFSMHLIIKRHNLASWCLCGHGFIHAYYLAFYWGYVVCWRFTCPYVYKFVYMSTWKFLWNLSPTFFKVVKVHVITICALTCFLTVLWDVQYVVVPKSIFKKIAYPPFLFAFFI